MGWKYTKNLTREEAILLITQRVREIHRLSNEELSNTLEGLGYGDNPELSHHGANFYVIGEPEDGHR